MNSLSLDKILFLYFNGNHNPFLDMLMATASNMLIWVPLYLIVVIIFLRILKHLNYSHITIIAVLVLLFIAFEVVICRECMPAFFHNFISRLTPCYDSEVCTSVRLVGRECNEKYAFFAYRAAIAVALTTFLSLLLNDKGKWIKYALILWALVVCYSRVYVGAHFPVNVLVSAGCGAVIGYVTYRFYYYVKNSMLVI